MGKDNVAKKVSTEKGRELWLPDRPSFRLVLFSSICVALAVNYVYVSVPSPLDNNVLATMRPWSYVLGAPVEVLHFSAGDPVVAPMLRLNQPRVIRGSFASQWPAVTSRQWTPEYLTSFLPDILHGVYFNTRQIFGPLWRPKPNTNISGFPRVNPFHVGQMAREPFLKRISGPVRHPTDKHPGQFVYYTGDLGNKSLADDIQPIRELAMADGTGQSAKINIWAGTLTSNRSYSPRFPFWCQSTSFSLHYPT